MAFAAYQDAFAAALLADAPLASAPPAIAKLVRQPGFAVYRNTVMKGCIDALQANYPTIARLVGDEWFRAAAAVFVRQHLPTQPSLLHYGGPFPAFLAAFEPAQAVPYLADVARVDRMWMESHAAPDAPPLAANRVAALTAAQMGRLTLRVHPAARWSWSDEWPIHSLWSRDRDDDGASSAPIAWSGEGVLITRPLGAVLVEPLSCGGVALLEACASGASIEAAAFAARDTEPGVDIAALIHQLLRAGAFSGLRPDNVTDSSSEEAP
jgi:Putative DNA-binding domain